MNQTEFKRNVRNGQFDNATLEILIGTLNYKLLFWRQRKGKRARQYTQRYIWLIKLFNDVALSTSLYNLHPRTPFLVTLYWIKKAESKITKKEYQYHNH